MYLQNRATSQCLLYNLIGYRDILTFSGSVVGYPIVFYDKHFTNVYKMKTNAGLIQCQEQQLNVTRISSMFN